MTNTAIVSVGWFSKQEWGIVKNESSDSSFASTSYEEWKKEIESTVQCMSTGGLFVRKIPILASEFISWCKSNHREVSFKSSSEYAGVKAVELISSGI